MLACLALLLAAPLSRAQPVEDQYELEIAAQPLTQALKSFADQTHLQYGYLPSDEEEERIIVGPLHKGRYTVREALELLLPPGFSHEWVNDRTIYIIPPSLNSPPGGVIGDAAARDQQHSDLSWEQRRAAAEGRSGSAGGPYHWDEHMTVEASRIGIDGLDFDVPMTVIDREQIKAMGVSTVTELLQFVIQQPFTRPEWFVDGGTQFVDLRGLGFDTTLVLINGRRAAATAGSLTINAFDLNSIPLPAVDRIELVSDSNSPLHGADAIGGVLNIVLRGHTSEPTVDIDYGAAAGGAVERRGAFSGSLIGARARGSIVLDYFDRSPLFGRERDRWNNQDFRRFGGRDWRLPTAVPGNVASPTPDNLPGLPSRYAAVPSVSSGTGVTPADFLATAGQMNLESLEKYKPILAEATRKSVVAQGDIALTPRMTGFGELLYADRMYLSDLGPAELAGVSVPATNAFNPFDQPVVVDRLLIEMPSRTRPTTSELLRTTVGVRGQVESWTWEISALRDADSAEIRDGNAVDPMRIANALAATDPDEALNVFGGPLGSPQLLGSLRAEPLTSIFDTEMTQLAAVVRGPLLSIAGRQIETAVGGEWRAERVRYDIHNSFLADTGSHRRSIVAGFAEVRVPLVNAEAGVPGVQELAVVVGGRADRYSDIGTNLNPQYALIWQPTSDWTVRASHSKSFRPPSLFDLHFGPVHLPFFVMDPRRQNEPAALMVSAGGSRNLSPSEAESVSLGLLFEPLWLPKLRIAANYWQVRMRERMGAPRPEVLLENEASFSERVIRGEPSTADLANGRPGPLQMIDISRMNFGSLETSGIDFRASYELETRLGRFTPTLAGAWIDEYRTKDLLEESRIDRVGVADLEGSVVRWRAFAGVTWSHGGISMATWARLLPSYQDMDSLSGRATGRRLPSQTIIDAQLAFDLSSFVTEHSPWHGLEVRAGASNLLDNAPSFAEVGLSLGHDPTQHNLRGRFSYVKLSKRF